MYTNCAVCMRAAPLPRVFAHGKGHVASRRHALVCHATRYLLVPNGDGGTDHISATFDNPDPAVIELSPGVFELGREGEVEIQVNVPTISARHALLKLDEDNVLTVMDLGSTNGTLLNGKEIEPNQEVAVRVGEEIVFGDSHLGSFIFATEESE